MPHFSRGSRSGAFLGGQRERRKVHPSPMGREDRRVQNEGPQTHNGYVPETLGRVGFGESPTHSASLRAGFLENREKCGTRLRHD